MKMFRIIKRICLFCFWHFCFLLPINNKKIFISSFSGKAFCDSPKYIAKSLIKKDRKIKIVCVLEKRAHLDSLDKSIVVIHPFSPAYVFHCATAKIWILNSRNPLFYKRKKQIYLQTWHGGGAQKKIEKDAIDSLKKDYIESAIKDSKAIDLFISDGDYVSRIFANSFWYNGPILKTGYPRYDILLNRAQIVETRKKVLNLLGIDEKNKVLLYAPTFRKDCSTSFLSLNISLIAETCEIKFGGSFVVLLRMHPHMKKSFSGMFNNRHLNVFDVTDYQDPQELLCATDVLVSDYSSILHDFSLLGRPAFRYAPDLDEYKNDRNFYIQFEDQPFPYGSSNKQLVDTILKFDKKEYEQNLVQYFKRIGQSFEPNSSDIISNIVIDLTNGSKIKDILQKNSEYVYRIGS